MCGFAAAILLLWTAVWADKNEHRLYKDLLAGYDILERPVANSSLPVTVYLGVILQQLVDVDEKNQIVQLNAWLKYTWTDYNLRWEPGEYSGLGDVRFPMGRLWKPDVLLYNSVDTDFDSTYPTNMVVYSDGTVNWIPPGIFKISCKIDITWYPFDDQNCFFKFGSWTYDGTKLDLQPDVNGMDISDYLVNGEWHLRGTTVVRSEKFYECCPEPYPDLKFFLHMRRRTLYYGFNLIIPCILITLMTILGFTLPPDAGEKISLQITVMLSICFFLGIVAEMTPPTSEAVPLLGAFFSCCMLLVSVSVVFTVVVLNLHHRKSETHKMGKVTRTLLLHWIPWLLFMQRPGVKLNRQALPRPFAVTRDIESEQLLRNLKPEQGFGGGGMDLDARMNQCFKMLSTSNSYIDTGAQAQLLLQQRIYAELRFITKRMADEDEEKFKENEWKFAAMVMDRLCLVLFSVLISVSTCGILFSAPYMVAG